MKLGKKALSCLLAIMMIVTSVSVCFSSLAAGDPATTAAALFNSISTNYDDLKNGTDLAATGDYSHVPAQVSGSNWEVAVDGYRSGWYWTAKSFYNFVQAYCASQSYSYSDVVTDAINLMSSQGLFGTLTQQEVRNFLNYFTFGGSTGNISLHIKPGYDILAWDTINEIDPSRSYYDSTLSFTLTSNKVTAAGTTWTESTTTNPESQTTVAAIKQALQDCVRSDAFLTWFNLDFDNMTVEEIMALVQGDTSCANTLAAFSTVANLSTSAGDEALWDHYVAPTVGKTWAQTNEWVQSGLMGAIYKAYAADYTRQLNTIMAEDTSAYTAVQKQDYYERFVAICLNLENQEDYQFNNIFELILPYMADGYYNKGAEQGTIYTNLWVDANSTVGAALATAKVNVAKQYATEYADAFVALIYEELPTYDDTNEEEMEAWNNHTLDKNENGIPDYDEVLDFVARANTMIANIDSDVLGYGTFDDVKSSFGTYEYEPGKFARITEDFYNTLKAKINTSRVNATSAGAYLTKAQMDAYMKSTILPGQTYANLQTIYSEFYDLYSQALALKNATDAESRALYSLIYGNGLTEAEDFAYADENFAVYTEYDHLIAKTALMRLYNKLDIIVNRYYNAGGSAGVKYYTFEAIIEAYSNLEVTPANLFNWLSNTAHYVAAAGE
ncbi:MAG: hypothetical protein IKR49_03040, partial [Clostridia bacterium]|nr:hypothetical protein [Clostridia bacterium]